jgi:DNA modification methylase
MAKRKKSDDKVFESGKVLVGSCLDRLRELPDESIDSIVTDPPYELGFMGKKWDSSGIAYNVALWEECLRVLKPGGHLLAFGGTRTYHRMAVAIEDAGFEIRDSIHWIYGSGFPKSLNVSKALEAQAKTGSSSPKGQRKAAMGDSYEPTPLAGTPGYGVTGNFSNKDTGSQPLDITTGEAKQWEGWGTALKPAHEPVVLARKPLAGTVAANVKAHGTGALNIGASRIGRAEGDVSFGGFGNGGLGVGTVGEGNGEGRNAEWVQSTEGRWPANIVLSHTDDCREVGTRVEKVAKNVSFTDNQQSDGWGTKKPITETVDTETSVWECADGCPVAELDEQSGIRTPGHWTKTKTTGFGEFGGGKSEYHGTGPKSEAGGASRFFYCAKPSKKERNAGLDDLEEQRHSDRVKDDGAGGDNPRNRSNTAKKNFHPTVKPLALMRYLVRLVTPPNGTVLDPFLGSGTTAVAATLEGFKWVGCELTSEYLPIIEGRVGHAEGARASEPLTLFGETS